MKQSNDELILRKLSEEIIDFGMANYDMKWLYDEAALLYGYEYVDIDDLPKRILKIMKETYTTKQIIKMLEFK